MVKKALITGINGQDASYLAEFLLEKGYDVHGTLRRNSVPQSQTVRIQHLYEKLRKNLHYMDLLDPISVERVISDIQPDEIYHLAAQSHVQISFDLPKYTLDTNAGGTLAILEAIRRFSHHSKMYNAATSEMFGNNIDKDEFQRETTTMVPVSPYGASKLYAYNLCHNYRNSYGINVSSGILFNHESFRRGTNFVTNKIALTAAAIYLGMANELVLGTLDSYRDWGHAKDYVKAMWMMLQTDKPKDYVVATGQTRSIRELLNTAFTHLNLNWEDYIKTNQKYMRPEELWKLRGDSSIIQKDLGWKPTITFTEMIHGMVDDWVSYFRENGKKMIVCP